MKSNFETRIALTTGEVARICEVAPRTVAKWCDNGKLRSYRIPSNSRYGDRRIEKRELFRFLQANNMPTFNLNGEVTSHCVVLAGVQSNVAKEVKNSFECVMETDSLFWTGELVERAGDELLALVYDMSMGSAEINLILDVVGPYRVMVLLNEDASNEDELRLNNMGMYHSLKKPFDPLCLVERLHGIHRKNIGRKNSKVPSNGKR